MASRYLKKKENKQKRESHTFKIDCKDTIEDMVIDINDFSDFLKKRVKVNGKKGNLGSSVAINTEGKTVISVNAEAPFSKRYLKYLTKKYLKKNNIRDYLRVVSSDKASYQLRYFNIQNEDAEDAE